jgi:hypothetical protein
MVDIYVVCSFVRVVVHPPSTLPTHMNRNDEKQNLLSDEERGDSVIDSLLAEEAEKEAADAALDEAAEAAAEAAKGE